MSQEIRDFVTPSCELFALGEPTHLEPAFQLVRNELFERLVGMGFRSIAMETDRVAALTVNDFVQDGVGTLDTAMDEGFSHTFGTLDTNRQLVTWMREYNESRPPEERLAFHGFDGVMEMMNAPSPRRYLEHARDYLELDVDIAALTGADDRWSRTEAVLDHEMSPGATREAEQLRTIADDMVTSLYARAPELVAKTSRREWFRAQAHLTAGIGMLRYHKRSAQPIEQEARWIHMSATRDALMAQNLLDIRTAEAGRGPTLVNAHNLHLQRNASHMRLGPMELDWFSAGAIVSSLVGERYTFVVGSLGQSGLLELQAPEPDTYEAALQHRFTTWGLAKAADVAPAEVRTDPTQQQGYFPLTEDVLDGADAVLHISTGTPAGAPVTQPWQA